MDPDTARLVLTFVNVFSAAALLWIAIQVTTIATEAKKISKRGKL